MANNIQKRDNMQFKKPGNKKFGQKPDQDVKVIQIDRVARVVAGGRRFKFRAAVVVGDGKGYLGIGVAKGSDVSDAISKASSVAKKVRITVTLKGSTIPYEIEESLGSSRILLKPASPGTGIIAGGAVRAVLEAAGVRDVLSKIIGSDNKINNIRTTFAALQKISDLDSKNKLLLDKDTHENPKDKVVKVKSEG